MFDILRKIDNGHFQRQFNSNFEARLYRQSDPDYIYLINNLGLVELIESNVGSKNKIIVKLTSMGKLACKH